MKTYLATFGCYQGPNHRDKLLARVVDCPSYDRISEPVAHPTKINEIQIKVWFRGSPERSRACAQRATHLSLFTLESVTLC